MDVRKAWNFLFSSLRSDQGTLPQKRSASYGKREDRNFLLRGTSSEGFYASHLLLGRFKR